MQTLLPKFALISQANTPVVTNVCCKVSSNFTTRPGIYKKNVLYVKKPLVIVTLTLRRRKRFVGQVIHKIRWITVIYLSGVTSISGSVYLAYYVFYSALNTNTIQSNDAV